MGTSGEAGSAVVMEQRAGEARLVAYVVCRDSERPSADELRRHLAARLPEYMVPHAFVFLDELPLTSNGKLDRKALPAPAPPPGPNTSPRTPTEARIAAIWAEVLGGCPATDDDFFAAGGDSLLAT